MSIRTQIFVIVLVLWALVSLVNMVRRQRVTLQYSLLWFVLGIGILVFACFPGLTARLAALFGIGLPINLLFFAGLYFAMMIIFSLSVNLSQLSEKNKQLTQELGLLKQKVEQLERSSK